VDMLDAVIVIASSALVVVTVAVRRHSQVANRLVISGSVAVAVATLGIAALVLVGVARVIH
jgi:hypothetical protein